MSVYDAIIALKKIEEYNERQKMGINKIWMRKDEFEKIKDEVETNIAPPCSLGIFSGIPVFDYPTFPGQKNNIRMMIEYEDGQLLVIRDKEEEDE